MAAMGFKIALELTTKCLKSFGLISSSLPSPRGSLMPLAMAFSRLMWLNTLVTIQGNKKLNLQANTAEQGTQVPHIPAISCKTHYNQIEFKIYTVEHMYPYQENHTRKKI